MDETIELPDIAIFEIHTGDGDGADIIFDYNGQRISVSVIPSPASQGGQDVEQQLIDLLGSLSFADADEEYEELQDEALSIILDAGQAIFDKVSQSDPPGVPTWIYTPCSTRQSLPSASKPCATRQ